MKKFFLSLVCTVLYATAGFAANIYIAQNSTGSNTGADCANAHSAAWFNTAANWGSGSTQIGPGQTVHLCGTFTGAAGSTMLTTQGSGASGSPITILAESGAVFTAPYWSSNGALFCNGHSNITFDGGTNGLITATANGDALTYHNGTSVGIGTPLTGCNNYTVRNWTVSNMYVKVEGSLLAVDDTSGIVTLGTNVLVERNIIDHVATAIPTGYCGQSHIEVRNNTTSYSNHHIASGASGTSCAIDDVKIHDNNIGTGAYIYDNVNNNYHHNGIQIFADSSNGPNPTITNMQVYNNYIHGVFSRDSTYGGTHTTAWIFINDGGGSGTIPNIKVFNNILVQEAGDLYGPANGYIAGMNAGGKVVNNTIVGSNNQSGGCINVANFSGTVIENNIMQSCGYAVIVYSGYGSGSIVDYNVYYNLYSNGSFSSPTGTFVNFSTWQAAGYDTHSVNGVDPKLSASFVPQTGSSAIGAGLNLTAWGIAALNLDKAGVARPAAGNWDVGAYQSGSSSPPPPTSLTPPGSLTSAVR